MVVVVFGGCGDNVVAGVALVGVVVVVGPSNYISY